MTLHELLDFGYCEAGDEALRGMIADGADIHARSGPNDETPLHVAARRRRASAVVVLLDGGADIHAKTAGGKTAYAHAKRRGFDEIATLLAERGADTGLNEADRFAVAVVGGDLDKARAMLRVNPGLARTGNPEEDRLLADVAGRSDLAPVRMLVEARADLTAPGLDTGTPLHQAAWFGQPANARYVIEAGAPLDVFEPTHDSSPLHWAVHGARFSGGAAERQDAYVEIVEMLLAAGASVCYPGDEGGGAYRERLMRDATAGVREVLERYL